MMNGKTQFKDNIIVAMEKYLDSQVLQILEKVIVGELVKINMDYITTLPAEKKRTVDEQNEYVIKLFLYKKADLAEETKKNYMYSIKQLITLIDKPLDIVIDENDIYYYIKWYASRNVGSKGKQNERTTINNSRRYLSAFFTWMRKEKMITFNPVDAVPPLKTIKKPIDYFSREEMVRMEDNCNDERDRALLEVLRSTGARIGEVVSMTRDMVDWQTGDVLIMSEKSNRYRTVYLDEHARYYLNKYLESRADETPELFVSSRAPHQGMTRSGLRNIFKSIGQRAGIQGKVYPHKVRKTLGMELKNRGVGIGEIQEIMGHANPNVTAQYYAQSTPESLRYVRQHAAA